MKKASYLIAAMLLLPAGAAAQLYVEPEKEVECSEFIVKQGRGRAQQGMEIYGRYIFSLEDGGHVNIYDFTKHDGKVIGSYELASSRKDNHANNAEFGVETAPGASFPLMYITNGKVGSEIEWWCFVESVKHKGKKWSSELVQTIKLNGSGWAAAGYVPIFGAPSWLIDRERGFLWVFSARQRTVAKVTANAWENQYIATKFRIPALAEGGEVHIGADDILDQVVFPYEVWFTQAGCMHDGKIYYGYGIGQNDASRPSRIRVYDTDTRRICARYDLDKEIFWEIEDICIKDGWMYVNTNNNPKKTDQLPIIYKLSMPKAKPAPQTALEELLQEPEKAGGIYYVDYDTQREVTPAPAGYEPVWITGYYRHGARQMDDKYTYPDIYNSLSKAHAEGNLTGLGESLWQRIEGYWPQFELRVCDLTMLGHRQAKESGKRIARAYPQIFQNNPYIKSISTSVVRVSETMHAFNLGVQSVYPSLEWDVVDATSSIIRFMNPYADGNPDKIPLDQILRDFRGEWYGRYKAYALSKFTPEDFMARLFKDTEPVKKEYDPFDYQWRWWLAASLMQGLDRQVPLWDAFRPEEIIAWAQAENYKYYMQKGPDPVNLNRGWGYGTRILRGLLDSADKALATGKHGMDMRFGHDGVLMATLTALQADDWDKLVTNPDEVPWKVWDIPMGANLMLVFYKNATTGDILVKAMLNERDCKLPLQAVEGSFYRWADVYPYYIARADKAEELMAESAKTDISSYPKGAVMHAAPTK